VRRGIGLILVVGLLTAACGSDDSESATQPETPIEVAEAVIDTWNGGDVAAFFGWFAEGATVNGDSTDAPGMYSDLGFYVGLGQTVAIEQCTPFGDTQVTCTTQASDELSGPLGVETPITWEFEVADGMVASLAFLFPPAEQPDLFVVANDAVLWVRDNHGDVFDESFRGTFCEPHSWNSYPDLWCSSPEGAEELLQLGDDFRAQYGS
jgi:hypothetical protein